MQNMNVYMRIAEEVQDCQSESWYFVEVYSSGIGSFLRTSIKTLSTRYLAHNTEDKQVSTHPWFNKTEARKIYYITIIIMNGSPSSDKRIYVVNKHINTAARGQEKYTKCTQRKRNPYIKIYERKLWA